LETQGGPFDALAFRHAWIRSFPDWRDASYGAEMADGTRAAISLLLKDGVAESLPNNYGTVVSSRGWGFGEEEMKTFLDAARRACGAERLIARSVPIRPDPSSLHIGARVGGWTSVVYLDRVNDLPPRFAGKARRSIRIATRAGAEVQSTTDPSGFEDLYDVTSRDHWMRYPRGLIDDLATTGLARFFDVRLGIERVASVMVLMSPNHWIAWMAAQDERGREINANYFATASMLAAAQRAGVAAVDLGVSAGMPGVAHFKRRFDAVDVPVVEFRLSSTREGIRSTILRAGRRVSHRARRLAPRRR
jgi:Acetyltransferase (GNAT) domain